MRIIKHNVCPAIIIMYRMRKLRKLYKHTPVRTILLTKGAAGVTLFERGNPAVDHPASPVERIVDTVGAGDAFSAGFLVGLSKNLACRQSVKLGNDFAARTCEISGAWPPPVF